MFEEKEERKKTFWNLGYWKQWMISDQVWRMGRGFPQTQHNGNISTNYQPWCQKLKKFNGRTHHPTWPPPPPPPPPYLSWRNTHSRPQGSRPSLPDHPFPSHYTSRFHCFLAVSSSGSFPEYVPYYPSLNLYLYFFLSSTEVSKFVFSFKVQALEEFMSWTWWIGLLAFLP